MVSPKAFFYSDRSDRDRSTGASSSGVSLTISKKESRPRWRSLVEACTARSVVLIRAPSQASVFSQNCIAARGRSPHARNGLNILPGFLFLKRVPAGFHRPNRGHPLGMFRESIAWNQLQGDKDETAVLPRRGLIHQPRLHHLAMSMRDLPCSNSYNQVAPDDGSIRAGGAGF